MNLLNRTQYFSPEENQLFSNICVCLSQINRADSKSLWAMITFQGGKCQLRLDRYCTHLITGKASGIKYETAMKHHINITTPDWIIECCKKGALVNEVEYHPRLLVPPNSSTAMITGFMDEDTDNNVMKEEQDRTKAMLEQLKQRMPWNQPSPPVSSGAPQNLSTTNAMTVPYSTNGQNTVNIQSQLSRSVPSTNLSTSTIVPSTSDQNVANQANWLSQASQQNNISQQMKAVSTQQQELSSQQQINMQHQLIQQQQLTQQQLQQPSYNQQQLLNQQQSSQQVSSQQQQLIGQQQSMITQQQQINSQLPQHQLTTQQQQLLTSQQKQLNQHQIIQQLQTSQSHLTQPQVQLTTQQQQQIVMQQLPSQQQQISGQHQLTQQQTLPQQLTPEQRQLILLQQQQQQQQQQKIQQISQQLQQSAQNTQQFVIRDGQLQQQSQNQQLIGPNQQGFIVQRDSQWQQQQYHLQLQRQQQQIGPQRSGGQWNQQPSQLPRQLIHLDAQTHQQLQQMDPQQRAQFIQKIQKQRNLQILQRQMQGRQAQQGPHIAVIRNSGKPVQPGSLQWVQQARPQMMGPQLAQNSGQKSVHPGVQPPALTPINSSNQVIVPTGQTVQGPQTSQTGQTFQQGQLTSQQLAQLHIKQQQMARLQQLQHLQQHQQQQQQQQQGAQQEPSLTTLSNNAQIPPDQQLVVNAKTKTALANMLTNRLQSGATEGSAAGQLRLMTAQHRPPPPPSQDPQLLAAYQRRTLGNLTNGASSGASIKMQYTPVMTQPKFQFFGHNPQLTCTYLFFYYYDVIQLMEINCIYNYS